MAVDDDIDSLEEELESLEDDDDGDSRRAMIMRFLPGIVAVGALIILAVVVLISYSGEEEEDVVLNVQKLQELGPGAPTIKIEPDAGAPVTVEGQENPAYNPMNQGADDTKVANVAPAPEKPEMPTVPTIAPEPGSVKAVPPPDAPPAEGGEQPVAMATEGGAATTAMPAPGAKAPAGGEAGKAPAGAENLMATPAPEGGAPAAPPKSEAMAPGEGKTPAAGTAETMVPDPKAQLAQAGTAVQPTGEKILKPPPQSEAAMATTTEFRTMAGVYRVQVASAKSEGLAQREWKDQVSRFPDVLSSLSLTVQRAVVKDRGTFYRVQGGPFPDRSAADSVCRKLKARGQDCLVVRP